MASLDLTRSRLLTLREDGRRLLSLCRRNPSKDCDLLITHLGHFNDVVVDLRALLNASDYKARVDVDHITVEVEGVALDAAADLRLLDSLLSRQFGDSAILKDLGNQFHKHSKSLQKLLDLVNGREDWSKLSLNVSAGALKTPKGGSSPRSPGLKVSFDTSTTSSGSRTAPPSPYVEEVPDTGEAEEKHGVETYHVNPPLFPDAVTTVLGQETSPPRVALRGSTGPEQDRSTPSPPRVVVRSPTDPKTMEAEVRSLHFDSPTEMGLEYQDTTQERDKHTQSPYSYYTAMDSSVQSLSKPSRPQSREEIESEIRRLTAEIERLKTPSSSKPPSSRGSRHSSSHSLDATASAEQLLPTPRTTRPRANTASGVDSRPTMKLKAEVQDESAHLGRPPHVSPRHSPLTPPLHTSPRPSNRAEERRTKSKRQPLYGSGPSDSLPTFAESGPRGGGLGFGFETEHKRKSWAADDFQSFQGLFAQSFGEPDPPLFGSGNEPASSKINKSATKDDLPPGVTQKKLPVTLENMCLGANKKVRFKRRVPDDMGIKLVDDTTIMTVQIYPGLKPGSRIKYPGEGDYNHETGKLGEVWFVLDEQDHAIFQRQDRDLHLQINVPLCDALCGWSKTVKSICGKEVKVKHAGPTLDGWKQPYAGLGMPKYDRDNKEVGGERGDMIVEVKVVMPPKLEDWQKDMIRRALGAGSPRHYGVY